MLSIQDRMPFEWLLLSVQDKKSAVKMTRGIRSFSAFRDTLHLHNVQIKTNNSTNKGHSFVTDPFFVGIIAWQMSRRLLFFSRLLHRNRRTKDAKTKQLAFTHFGTPGHQYTPFCSLLRFHLAEKGKLIANPQYL